MSEVPLSALFGALAVLIVLSACFSGSETGLMTLNRYRLRHLAKTGNRGARLADRLLSRPDRLIGVILLGNNLVNISAASLTTVIALRLGGEGAIGWATLMLTAAILIFSEVAPKTVAAIHPERVAFPASFALAPLLRLLYPFVWAINLVANGLLRLLGISLSEADNQHITQEELRTVVNEAGAMIPRRHQRMLLNILDLERAEVEDIMVPRNEIFGIDLDNDWDSILEQLTNTQYTRMPVYRESIDSIEGVIHVRRLVTSLLKGNLDLDELMANMREPYFVPEGTPLHTQLLNFQARRRRIGLVVDEYGDIMGLITLEDILEEIVGEFTTDPSAAIQDVYAQDDGSYLVEGGASIRDLNRILNWQLPTDGPKTLNGLILEHMETIPEPGTSLMLEGVPVTIVQVQENRVKMARVQPRPRRSARRGND